MKQQGQSLYYGNMYEGMSLYRSLAIMYYMLLAMNTSEAVGRSAMPLFAHISMSIAWMLTLGNNGWLYYVKQGLVKAYRRLAWQMSSFGSGKESTETVGRYYQHVGAEKFAQGQLRDAAFNFAHALELYQLANMKLYWHVTGNMLALVYVFQEEIDKGLRETLLIFFWGGILKRTFFFIFFPQPTKFSTNSTRIWPLSTLTTASKSLLR